LSLFFLTSSSTNESALISSRPPAFAFFKGFLIACSSVAAGTYTDSLD
jgi:hypothetical protein